MTVKLYAFTCGTVTGEFAHLMEGGEGDITVPIPVFLIEHPKGRALFDAVAPRAVDAAGARRGCPITQVSLSSGRILVRP